MGLLSNFKKAIEQKKKDKDALSQRMQKFPSIIDESVKPADITKMQPSQASDDVQKSKLELPRLNIPESASVNESPAQEKNFEEKADAQMPEFRNDNSSFFLSLYNDVKDGNISENDFNSENLLMKMKGFWKNDELVIKNKSENEKRKINLMQMTEETLSSLTNLENRWRTLKIESEKLNFAIKQIESDIESESYKFKELIRKIKFHEDVMPENYFKLFDGKELKNLHELLGSLKMMSDYDFYKHVTNERNDFANWVRGTLKEGEVAARMENLRDKNAMISFLELQLSHEGIN